MQCPSCRSDIPDNQFYCPVCRASVYSYVPENSRSSSGGRLERAGKRLLEVFLFLILVGIGVVLARAIKWKDLLGGILPATATSSTPKPEPSSGSAGKRGSSTASKASEGKSNDAAKPASAENTGDKKPKEESSSSESKPTPKPTPTPKTVTGN